MERGRGGRGGAGRGRGPGRGDHGGGRGGYGGDQGGYAGGGRGRGEGRGDYGGGRGGHGGDRGGGRGGGRAGGGRGGFEGRGGGRFGGGGGRGGPPGGRGGRGPSYTEIEKPKHDVQSGNDFTNAMNNLLAALPAKAKALAQQQRPVRPDHGSVGQRMMVRCNHFAVSINRDQAYHYDVAIERLQGAAPRSGRPAKPLPVSFSRATIKSLAQQRNWPPVWAFDGRKNLYTAEPIEGWSDPHSCEVHVESPGGSPETMRVDIKPAAIVDLQALRQYVRAAKGSDYRLPQDAVQCLDVAMRNRASFDPKVVALPRAFFYMDRNFIIDLPSRSAEVWLGYNQSVRPAQTGLTLNIDITFSAFIKAQPLAELIASAAGAAGARALPNVRWAPGEVRAVNKEVRGVQIQTTYEMGTPDKGMYKRRYRVRSIAPNGKGPEALSFKLDTGRQLTVLEYYKEHYGINLTPGMPCVLVGGTPDRPVYVPSEAADVLAGQRKLKLDDRSQAEMIKRAAISPQERADRTKHALTKQPGLLDDLTVSGFGMNISSEMEQVEAYQLPPPRLRYQNEIKVANRTPGSWEPGRFEKPGDMRSYCVASFGDRRDESALQDFLVTLLSTCYQRGISCPNPQSGIPIVHHPPGATTEQTLKDALVLGKEQFGMPPSIILVMLPQQGVLHGEVKVASDHRIGIPSQCFVAAKAGIDSRREVNPHKRRQYCDNVALKINAKLGGYHTAVDGGFKGLSERPFMIIGADVTHPAGFNKSAPSIASVVGSLNASATVYAERSRLQPHRTEMIQDLKGMVKELLLEFYHSTKRKPEKIIMYRDGISEGQFEQVQQQELPQITAACLEMGDGQSEYRPPITFVVVQKRHHTRFYPANPRDADRSGNVLPGVMVDRKICHPFEFDFYLNSHAGIQGTNRPAHYHVLLDENSMGANRLQNLTYSLCYLFCRCTRSVSLCPPAFYAHLAAFRQRELCQIEDSSGSEETMSTTSGGAKSFSLEYAKPSPLLSRTMYYV